MDEQKIDGCIQTLSEFLNCINDLYYVSDDEYPSDGYYLSDDDYSFDDSYLYDENTDYIDEFPPEENWDFEDNYNQDYLEKDVSNLDRIINELENYFSDLSSNEELYEIKEDLKFGNISKDKLDALCDIHQKLVENLESQVPDKLKEYFYSKCLLADFQSVIPEDTYNNLMDKILELDDSSKVDILETSPSLNVKFEIINSLRDENIKLDHFSELPDSDRLNIAFTFQDDDNKLEALKLIVGNKEKLALTLSLDDDYKIKALSNFEKNEINSKEIAEICSSFSDQTKIMDVFTTLDIFDDKTKFNVISTIDNSSIKLTLFDSLDNLSDKRLIINQLEKKQDPFFIEAVNKLNVTNKDKVSVISNFSEESKIKFAEYLQHNSNDKQFNFDVIQTIGDEQKIFELLDKGDFDEDKMSLLKRLYQKNNKLLKNIDYRMIDDKYIDKLGEDKINLISCYPDIQNKILNLSDSELSTLCKCIDDFMSEYDTEVWTTMTQEILKHITEYSELINSLDIDNMDDNTTKKLRMLLQNANTLDIATLEELDNHEKILKKVCTDAIYGDEDLEEKKSYLLQYLFGHDLYYADDLLRKYNFYDNLENDFLKNYLSSLQLIVDLQDEDLLKEIFEDVEEPNFFLDKCSIENELKREYLKLYTKDLYTVDENSHKLSKEELAELKMSIGLNDDELNDCEVYDAGTDFKAIVTSVAPFVVEININDYKEHWNKPSMSYQHFCASYIRNDMIAVARIPHVCYGFSNFNDDSLMLSGPFDIFSRGHQLVSTSDYEGENFEKYLPPNEQINLTEIYNEMDFARIQNGQKKQPDYIVAFIANNEIKNIDTICKAYEDWQGALPIVIFDVDRCLEHEAQSVIDKIEKYQETGDSSIAISIQDSIINNNKTLDSFKQEDDFGEFIEEENHFEELIEQENDLRKQKGKPYIEFLNFELSKVLRESKANDTIDDRSEVVSEKDLAENYDNVEKAVIPKLTRMLKQLVNVKENKGYDR